MGERKDCILTTVQEVTRMFNIIQQLLCHFKADDSNAPVQSHSVLMFVKHTFIIEH